MVFEKAIASLTDRWSGRRARRREYLSLSATIETPTGRGDTDGFFAQLKTITNQTGEITHAFNDSQQGLIGYVQLHRARNAVTIHRIWTVFPRRGYGSRMLREVCALADRHRVFIQLKVAPLGPRPFPMSAEELREWYHRHGFRGDKRLIRSPGATVFLPKEK